MQDIVEKWGVAVARRGFAQLPNYLLQVNSFVAEEHKLTATELLVLIHLVASWWKKEEMPFPSMRTLSERSGISERQVQRAIKGLEEKRYLTKTRKRIKTVLATNVYDLSPTVRVMQEIAEHYVNDRPRKLLSEKKTPGSDLGAETER